MVLMVKAGLSYTVFHSTRYSRIRLFNQLNIFHGFWLFLFFVQGRFVYGFSAKLILLFRTVTKDRAMLKIHAILIRLINDLSSESNLTSSCRRRSQHTSENVIFCSDCPIYVTIIRFNLLNHIFKTFKCSEVFLQFQIPYIWIYV